MRIPREHLILKRRELDQIRDEAAKIVDYNEQFDLKVSPPDVLITDMHGEDHDGLINSRTPGSR